VQVPNEGADTELTLHGALHVPAISYTLVSEKGYHTHISGSHLELTSPQGERVSRIARTQGHLYAGFCQHCESGAVVGVILNPDSQEMDCKLSTVTVRQRLSSQRGGLQAGRAPALAAAVCELVITLGLLIAWLLLQAQYVRRDCQRFGVHDVRAASNHHTRTKSTQLLHRRENMTG